MSSIKPLTLETMELYNAYVDWLNDDLNFSDESVGFYWTSKIDEDLVNYYNENFSIKVMYWDEKTLVFKDGEYYITIKQIDVGEESKWIVAEIG